MSKKTSIGGQALIEGIMMKGPDKTCIAVRKPDGEIELEYMKEKHLKDKYAFFGLPVIRGVVAFIESMISGYKALMISAEKSGFDDEESKEDGNKPFGVLMVVASVLGVAIALTLFMWAPARIFDLLKYAVGEGIAPLRSVFEGTLKILIFVAYIYFVSKTKDIKRVFMYHGAEHKTIFCYECGGDLTPEKAKNFKRFHPRCGTSFLILMLLVSIIVNGIIANLFPAITLNRILWVAIKILLVPLICGLGYELIKICGKYDNLLTRIISAPGMWLQRLTTKEPDDDMLEVAIAALEAVIPEDSEKDNW